MDPVRSRGRAIGRGRAEARGSAGGGARPGGGRGASSSHQQPQQQQSSYAPQQQSSYVPQQQSSHAPQQQSSHAPQQGQAPRAWGPRPGGPPRPQMQAAPPPQQSAWGPRPSSAPQHQAGRAQSTQHHQGGRAQPIAGTSSDLPEHMETLKVSGGPSQQEDNRAVETGGRGSVRGRRQIPTDCSMLKTKPAGMGSKQGTAGTKVMLQANYFPFHTHTDWCLYQYRVDFAPEEDRTRVKKQMMAIATKHVLSGYIFDGSMLFTSRRIDPDPMELFVDSPAGNEQKVRITLRLVGDVAMGDYHLLQFFNIMMRKCLSYMKLQLVGRNYYDAIGKIMIPQYNIELWPGYITSIRQHENQILLCCEISHKFMRTENVLNVMRMCYQDNRQNFKKNFMERIVGSVVLTDYNNRTYRIDDVDWNVTPGSSFDKSDGTSITYIDYYQQRYQLRINDVRQPMLVSRAKARELRAGMSEIVYLIPELCRMTGLTEAERNNMMMMRDLANHTRLAPDGRIGRYMHYSQRMQTTKEIVDELAKWDMKLAPNLVEFTGRRLPQEVILQSENGKVKYGAGDKADWSQNLRSNRMVSLGTVNNWTVIVISSLKNDTMAFVQCLQKAASGMGFLLPNPSMYDIRDDKPASYLDALDVVMTQHKPNFILCVASNNKVDRYSAIKKKCCVDKAMPTQVILRKNITAKNPMSVATKVAIQINCKLGGAPWTVEMPFTKMMVVGFDVCHDASNKGRSYGAMVASLDRQLLRYYSVSAAHSNGEELSNDFALSIMKAVKQYELIHKCKPEQIVIYRDGVGDGQLPYVQTHEVTRIKTLLDDYYQDVPKVKMAFIVVTKRINTRIFQNRQNPPPGTVVDDVITLPQRYDFYIISQCVKQGTVSPTSYNVLHDDLNIGPDRLQRLTYKLTHMYFNWSGTVRVPAPCQYAHKLAFLVSQALHRDPNVKLSNVLYFL